MNKKMIMRTVLSAVIILLLIITGAYFYSLLSKKEKESDTNLYTLIPKDCIAILETDNAGHFFHNINNVNYERNINSLKISELLYGLKNNFETLSDNKIHGFSKQMSQIIVSFHQPNTSKDQILYCKLGSGDKDFIKGYSDRNTSILFPPKTFEYRNEKIHIYPLNATEFLACYYHQEFLVVSYQEKLIEKVIDTYLDKESILCDSVFASIVNRNKTRMEATIFIKGEQIELGNNEDKYPKTTSISHWGEFDIKLNPDAIYLSGTSFDTDSCNSFDNALKTVEPVPNISGKELPESTYFLCQLATSNMEKIFKQITQKEYPPLRCYTPQEKADSCMLHYFKEYAENTMSIIMFTTSQDENTQRIIANIPVKDRESAESYLKSLIPTFTGRKIESSFFHFNGKAYQSMTLPRLTFTGHFVRGIIKNRQAEDYVCCFYNDRLLIAPNDTCIQDYIHLVDNGKVKEGDVIFEECMAGLAPESACLLMTDMSKTITEPQLYGHLMPNFFFKNKDFFRNFLMTTQFTTANGTVFPSITLTYKGEL